jgi:eukaryotic-like serine/threonine-protein kinase
MDTNRNLALQADLIDSSQFVEICTLWTTRKSQSLADLLLERGWIVPSDVAHVDYLLERKLKKHGGDPRASLAAVADPIKRSLAALCDAEIECSLAGLPPAAGQVLATTVDHVASVGERYTLRCLHATGGIGRVWLAHDSALGRNVALKELRPEKAEQAALWTRFLREARITGQLEHPGIVPVYELARQPENQQPFYTMRFVKGRTLTRAVQEYHQTRAEGRGDSLNLLTLLNAFVTVCNTIAYAHSRGVIHRDLKGQNVVLGDFGEVVVLDWGLAKLVGRLDAEPAGDSIILDQNGSGEGDLTVHGQAVGTPGYMAPEQAAGRLDLIDQRTDADGTFRACNKSAERILGLTAEQMKGRTPLNPGWQAIREDGSPFPGESFPTAVTLRTGRPCSDVVMGIHKPTGELTWISINCQPLFREGEHSPYAVVASFEDITVPKRTEEMLKRTTAELARVKQQLHG